MALRLRGASSGYIELKAPASAGDNTLTLPTNNGSANTFLKTDGSGNLSWQSNLTFDGTKLDITTSGAGFRITRNSQYIELDGNFGNGGDQSLATSAGFRIQAGGVGNSYERLRITSTGALGTNSTVRSAYGGLDLCSQGATNLGTLTLGAGGGQNGQSRSANQENQFRIMMPTYADPSNMTTVLYGVSGSAGHELHYGGGTGWAYATNSHKFFTTGNQTTGTGTERLKIDSNGNLTAVNTAAGGQSVTLSVGASNASGVNDGIIKIINGGTGNGVIQWDYENNANRAQIYVYRSTQELIFTVAGNERARITDDGIKLPADKGINFSAYATSGSNPSSNLLDDYEEGYHTPTIVGATSGSWTISTYTTLAYTKIGRVVHIGGYLNISSESSPSGAIRISLPVAVGTFTHDSGNNSLSVSLRGHNGSTALYNVTAAVSEGTSYMELIAVAGNGVHTWIGDGQVDGSANIRIGGHYFTD